MRNIKSINTVEFKKDLGKYNFDKIIQNLDNAVQSYTENILETLNHHAPIQIIQ